MDRKEIDRKEMDSFFTSYDSPNRTSLTTFLAVYALVVSGVTDLRSVVVVVQIAIYLSNCFAPSTWHVVDFKSHFSWE